MEPPKPVESDPEAVIRDLDDAHLEYALRLWENGSAGTPVAFSLADVLGAIAARQPALVALVGGQGAGAISRSRGGRRRGGRRHLRSRRRRAGVGAALVGCTGAAKAGARRGAPPRARAAAALA